MFASIFAKAKNFDLPRKLRQVTIMRRFEMMMATATTKIRPACMRASNECSSIPPPFRAASPPPTLKCLYPSPFSRSFRYTGSSQIACTFSYCTLFFVFKASPHLLKGKFLGLDTVRSSRILIYNRRNCITVKSKEF